MKRIDIIGNLTSDAQMKLVESKNKSVINFTVAVNTKHGNDEKVDFFDCGFWKKNEETKLTDYLKKGVKVFVSGEPELKTYMKGDEQKVSIKINVRRVELLSNPK